MKQIYRRILAFTKPYTNCQIKLFAAATCQYILLSTIPVTIILSILVNQISFSHEIVLSIKSLIPPWIIQLLQPLEGIHTSNHRKLLSLSGLSLIWSASKSIVIIREGLNHVMEQNKHEHYVTKRFRAIISFMIIFFLFGVFILLYLLWPAISILLVTVLPVHSLPFILFQAYAAILVAFLLSAFYRLIPERKLSVKRSFPISCVLSLILIGFSRIFTLFVIHLSTYDNMYGIFGTFLLAIIWMQSMIAAILLCGRYLYLHVSDKV